MKIAPSSRRKPPRKREQTRPKFLIGAVICFLLLIGSLFVWLSREDHHRPGTPVNGEQEVEAEPPIANPRIALLLPLTGPFQTEGQLLHQGIELAWKEIKKKGIPVELAVGDAGSGSRETLRLAEEMAHNPDTLVIIAHLPIASLIEMAPLLERNNLLALLPAGSHQQLTQYESFLPLVCLDGEEGAYAATVAAHWEGTRTAAVVHNSSIYSELLYESFLRRAQELHLTTAEFVSDADGLFADGAIDEILKLDPPLIWLAGSPFWGAEIIRALAEKGYTGRFLAPRSYTGALVEDLLGDYLDRLFVMRSALVADDEAEPVKQFRERFREEYWREPQRLAVLGYDAMSWLGELLERGPTNRSGVGAFFLSFNNPLNAYKGLAGPVYFDSDGKPERPLRVMTFRDGRFVPVEPEENRSKRLSSASGGNSTDPR